MQLSSHLARFCFFLRALLTNSTRTLSVIAAPECARHGPLCFLWREACLPAGFNGESDSLALANDGLLDELGHPARAPIDETVALPLVRSGDGAHDALDLRLRGFWGLQPLRGWPSFWNKRRQCLDEPIGKLG